MKTKTFFQIISLVLALVMTLSLFAACDKPQDNDPPVDDTPAKKLCDISDFTIIRVAGDRDGRRYATTLKDLIKSVLGMSISVKEDGKVDAAEKEILIGATNRPESQETIDLLKNKNDKDSYAIRIFENNKIVITGTDAASTDRAVKIFIKNYVKVSPKGTMLDITAGDQIGIYDSDYTSTLSNGYDITTEYVSSLFEVSQKNTLPDGTYACLENGSYAKITQLQYQQNEADNGKLIAIFSASLKVGTNKGAGNVFMSEDQGKTWNVIARPEYNPDLFPMAIGSVGSMAHIYELPAQVGDMPAGTLLYSHCAINYKSSDPTNGNSFIAVWRSFDGGYTWEEDVIVDEAQGLDYGIWEPFMMYCEEDQYLYCFYSDDSDPEHDQKVVYKRSKDGINWEGEGGKTASGWDSKTVEPVEVVALNEFKNRPGMPVITKLGNGEYFIVYEIVNYIGGAQIYYKKTTNLADWGDPSNPGTLIGGISGPCCAWLPAGGECGTLIVTSKTMANEGRMYASTDYGLTWQSIVDPLESDPINSNAGSDRVGYSAGFWVDPDGKTLYYVNSDNSSKNPTTSIIRFAKFVISDPVIDPD